MVNIGIRLKTFQLLIQVVMPYSSFNNNVTLNDFLYTLRAACVTLLLQISILSNHWIERFSCCFFFLPLFWCPFIVIVILFIFQLLFISHGVHNPHEISTYLPEWKVISLTFEIYTYWWWWFSHQVVSHSCDPMDCSPPGSSVHGTFQARILEWIAISFSIYTYYIYEIINRMNIIYI